MSVQDVELNWVEAPLLVLHVMEPVGVLRVPASVSVTEAVQVTDAPVTIELGVQLTAVLVWRLVTVTVAAALLGE